MLKIVAHTFVDFYKNSRQTAVYLFMRNLGLLNEGAKIHGDFPGGGLISIRFTVWRGLSPGMLIIVCIFYR